MKLSGRKSAELYDLFDVPEDDLADTSPPSFADLLTALATTLRKEGKRDEAKAIDYCRTSMRRPAAYVERELEPSAQAQGYVPVEKTIHKWHLGYGGMSQLPDRIWVAMESTEFDKVSNAYRAVAATWAMLAGKKVYRRGQLEGGDSIFVTDLPNLPTPEPMESDDVMDDSRSSELPGSAGDSGNDIPAVAEE